MAPPARPGYAITCDGGSQWCGYAKLAIGCAWGYVEQGGTLEYTCVDGGTWTKNGATCEVRCLPVCFCGGVGGQSMFIGV